MKSQKSHEAIQTAVDGHTLEHAKRLRLSTSSLYKHMEPSTDFTDSGTLNPLDRIETIIETALTLGTPQKKALGPLNYLAGRFNVVAIPLPHFTPGLGSLTHELVRTISEFGDLVKASSDAMMDGTVTNAEAAHIDRESWEAIRQIVVHATKVKASVK